MVKEKITGNKRIVFRKSVNYWAMLILILGFSTSMASGMPEATASYVSSGIQLQHGEIAGEMHSDDCGFSHEDVDAGIEKAISFLKERQISSGGFPAYISKSPNMSNSVYMPLVYDTSFILHALTFVDSNSEADGIKDKIVEYMLANKEEPGVWRFYGKNPITPPDSNELVDPYIPPDMDDTAVAFASLRENGIPIEESGLEYALNFRNSDGLFNTWINEEKWLNKSDPLYLYFKQNDIDIVVNANMLYALSLAGKQEPDVSSSINNYIMNNSFVNPTLYYNDPYIQLYMFTRAYKDGNVTDLGPSMPIIINYLLSTQKEDGSWGNEMNTSQAAVSLLNTGYKGRALDKAIEHILSTQRNDGGWAEIGVKTGGIMPDYVGSEDFTTAFSLEALSKYDELHEKNARNEDLKEYT
ncbi:Prenyltransferase and squalene oxidase repeat protein [uncultured archaeon]|nr:Prenyltransferase and squalene oxidase repeat protein [uncultured archaeon]